MTVWLPSWTKGALSALCFPLSASVKKNLSLISKPLRISSNHVISSNSAANFLIRSIFLFLAAFLSAQICSFANNLSITGVSLEAQDSTNDTIQVVFDLSWDNSWKDETNHDAV